MQFVKQLIEFLFAPRAIQLRTIFQNGEDVLLNRQLAKNRRFLRQVAKAESGPAVHRQGSQVLSIEQYPSAVRCNQPDDHVESGGLAGTIRTQQANDFAAGYLQRDSFDNFAKLVALGNILNAQNTHRGTSPLDSGISASFSFGRSSPACCESWLPDSSCCSASSAAVSAPGVSSVAAGV